MNTPPVFYSLIQVRFNRVSQMASYVPPFQDALRKTGFADYREEKQLEVQILGAGAGQPNVEQLVSRRWVFNDLAGQEGFVLLEDALVYHTTNYARFSDCLERMLTALTLLDDLLGISHVERVGMRYLDAIQPIAPRTMQDYVLPELLGLSQVASGTLKHSYSETVQLIGDATLVMKAFVAPQGLPLPPDLQQLALQLPETVRQTTGPSLVMDSDCYVEKRFAYSKDIVEERIRQLHGALLDIFKQSLTPEARQQWKL